ncbi:hypothetical protein FRC06_004902 [Ceratobasidium sp. 370]|nr:hypothetical protein FRC06_004902 [Ceratobasidium sp. 370]
MALDVDRHNESFASLTVLRPKHLGWWGRAAILRSWVWVRFHAFVRRLLVFVLGKTTSAVKDVWSLPFRSPKHLYNFSDIRAADVAMDAVDGQIVSWLLHQHEEVQRTNIGLRALSGARHDLPLTAKAKGEAFKLIEVQRPLFKQLVRDSSQPSAATLSTALMYARCYAVLISGSGQEYPLDRWQHQNGSGDSSASAVGFMKDYFGLLKKYKDKLGSTGVDWHWDDVVIATTAVGMRFCHWHGSLDLLRVDKQSAPSAIATSILRKHLESNDRKLPDPQLYELVKSTADFLIGQWPRESAENSRSSLPMLLARIFLLARCDSPIVASAAATVLVSAMTAMYSFPGESSPSDVDSREKQATKSLSHHHRSVEQALEEKSGYRSTAEMDTMFIFGFLGLLPKIDFGGPDNNIMDELSGGFEKTLGNLYTLNPPIPLFGFPATHTIDHHVVLTTCRYLLRLAEHPDPPHDDEQAFSLFLFPQLKLNDQDTRLYITALIALCRSNSDGIRSACEQIIDTQSPFPIDLELVTHFDGNNLLDLFYRNLNYDPPTSRSSSSLLGLAHFRLLVVGIMLSASNSLEDRRAALKPLWDQFNEPAQYTPQNPTLSDRDLISHVKGKPEDPQKDLASTLRLVGDFLNTTLRLSIDLDWHKELQSIKDGWGRGTGDVQADASPTETGEPSASGIGVSDHGQTPAPAVVIE